MTPDPKLSLEESLFGQEALSWLQRFDFFRCAFCLEEKLEKWLLAHTNTTTPEGRRCVPAPQGPHLGSATLLVGVGHLLSTLASDPQAKAQDFSLTQVPNAGLQDPDISSENRVLRPLTFRDIGAFLGLAWWSFSLHTERLWIQTTASVTFHRQKVLCKISTVSSPVLPQCYVWAEMLPYSVLWHSQGLNNYLGQEQQNAMETEVEHNAFTRGKSHWLSLHRKCYQLLNNNR